MGVGVEVEIVKNGLLGVFLPKEPLGFSDELDKIVI